MAVDGRGQLRLESLERLTKGVGAPREDPGIPQVAALVQERCGGRGIGLLDEALDGGRVRGGMQPLAGLDVAVPGGRMGRHHAEGHEVPALGHPRGLAQRFDERVVVGDEMVRRQDDADLVALAPHQRGGKRGRDRGRARQWLAEHVVRRQLRELVLGGANVGLAGDDVDVVRPEQRVEPRDGLLEQAGVTGQRQELLRRPATGQRPETSARTAGHDHRVHQSRSTSASSRSPSSRVRR